MVVLTKNLKMLYLNMDQLLLMRDSDKTADLSKMTIYDRIYGQQSFVLCSKMIATGQKQKSYLIALTEFRLSYVQNELNKVFQTDNIQKIMLGARGKDRKKVLPRELASDIEIHCSLSYSMNQPPFTQQILSILLTVDAHNVLHVFAVYTDQSELLFKVQINWTDKKNDYAVCCELYLRAKAILVCSRLGENVVITSQLKQFPVFGEPNRRKVSRLHFFEYRGVDMIAVGLRTGECILKKADTLLSDQEEVRIAPKNF
jgi:hypothetical protein